SLTLFGLLGAPFLWFGGSTQGFLLALGPTWALFALASTGLYFLYRRDHRSRVLPPSTPRNKPLTKPADQASVSWKAWGLLGAYAVLVAVVLSMWTFGKDSKREGVTEAFPVLLAFGGLLAWGFRKQVRSLLVFDEADDAPSPRLWTILAIALIVLQAISAVVYYRPDWDDCYYLAAVLDYEDAEVLNDQEPTHREHLPVSAHQRFMCWELWGAVLCRFSGLNPMVVFHSV